MKRLLIVAATLSALPLAACAGGYYGGGVGYADAGPIGYDGFYDDFYGPVYDGYWGDDGAFYYRGGAHERHFRRGDPSHFQRGGGPGGPPPGGHFHAMQGNLTPGRGMSMPHFGGPGGGGFHGGGHGHH